MSGSKKLSERDICTKFITPALTNSGWDIQDQIREEVTFTSQSIETKLGTKIIMKMNLKLTEMKSGGQLITCTTIVGMDYRPAPTNKWLQLLHLPY